MTVAVDVGAVRQFIEIISGHVTQIARNSSRTGVLQLCRLSPVDETMVPTRFKLDDVEPMIKTAVNDANASFNVYVEVRTVRADLRGKARGSLDDTELVFGLVVDADNDKGKGGVVKVRPSLVVETSPGNFHYWYLFTQPVTARQAKTIGDAIRASTGTDQDTGVVTQCYRVAGTPNFPSKAKMARGRVTVEPTRIVEWTSRLWDPYELLAAFTPQAWLTNAPVASPTAAAADESSLPDDLMKAIRDGGGGNGKDKSRSGLFHHVVGELKKRRWAVEQIRALFEKHPNGVSAKYQGRLLEEIERSYGKVENGAPSSGVAIGSSVGGSPPPPPPGVTSTGQRPVQALPLMSSPPSGSETDSCRALWRRPKRRCSHPAPTCSRALAALSTRSAKLCRQRIAGKQP
jgi:hypothetical protein